jgi:hypothetical protein
MRKEGKSRNKLLIGIVVCVLIVLLIFVGIWLFNSGIFNNLMLSPGNTYYVSTTGNDSNPGSQSLPFRTIQKAANVVNPGDVVNIQPGTYAETVTISRSGIAGSPITFIAPNKANFVRTSGWQAGITISANYIIVDNLVFDSMSDNPNARCILISANSSNNIVRNITISNSSAQGLVPFETSTGSSNNLFTNNLIKNVYNLEAVAYVKGSNNIFSFNEVFNYTANTSLVHPDFVQTFGCFSDDSNNIVIESNYIHDSFAQFFNIEPGNGWNGSYCPDTLNPGFHNWTFRNNIVYNLGIQGNIGLPNTHIYNNLFYNSSFGNGFVLAFYKYGNNSEVYNNVFINAGSLTSSSKPIENSGGVSLSISNNYVGRWDGFNYYPVLVSGPLNGSLNLIDGGDPKFVNINSLNFNLLTGSPLINTGKTLSPSFADKDGNSRPQGSAWDIGAYEYATLGSGATTPGVLSLSSTFESISIRAKFSGDSDGDNNASIQFRKVGDLTWKNAYSPIIDRRNTINGADNSAYVNESRGSIVGLQPDTDYEVKLIWMDSDGISGSNEVAGTIRTLSYNPPSNGRILIASPSNLSSILATSLPGDKIYLTSGTYAPFTISRSGNSTGYITIEGIDSVIVQGGAVTQNIAVLADYIRIKGITFAQSQRYSINIGSGYHHIFIENTIHQNIASSIDYGSAGVRIQGLSHNIFILNNTFLTNQSASSTFGVYFESATNGTFVIGNNLFNGTFRDNIGGACNCRGSGLVENSDVFGNQVVGAYQDDGIEIEGDNVNVRVYGNAINGVSSGYSGLGLAGTIIGPAYIFRNNVKTSMSSPVVKLGNGGVGYTFFFHNTFIGGDPSADGLSDMGGDPKSELHTYYNNIIKSSRYGIYRGGRSNNYNYNLWNPSNWLVDEWNVSGSYQTLSSFRSATSQELNGIQSIPGFVAGSFQINSTSQAIDKALVLNNFNSIDSAWPYSGSSPDIGAYEYVNGQTTNYHSADINQNWKINSTEVVRYDYCRINNATDPGNCNFYGFIPSSYVPNADYLRITLADGSYRYNSSFSCPGCWISGS